jgi:hypothetical protein
MSKNLYTLRGFKPFSEPAFVSTGVIEQFTTFETKTVEKQHEVLVEMLTGPLGISARTLSNVSNGIMKNVVDVRDDKTVPVDEVIIINITLDCALDKDDLKDIRPVMVESFMRWAEKSRVRGSRGWRVSAVRNPTFEKNTGSGGPYLMKAQVLLSNAIFYDQDTVKVGLDPVVALKDLENLKRHINKSADQMSYGYVVNELRFDHSVIGKGVIV